MASVHNALQSINKAIYVKVDQEPNGETAESQVRQQLGSVNWEQFGHRLQFNHDLVFNQEIDPVAHFDMVTFVRHRNGHLSLDGDISEREILH